MPLSARWSGSTECGRHSRGDAPRWWGRRQPEQPPWGAAWQGPWRPAQGMAVPFPVGTWGNTCMRVLAATSSRTAPLEPPTGHPQWDGHRHKSSLCGRLPGLRPRTLWNSTKNHKECLLIQVSINMYCSRNLSWDMLKLQGHSVSRRSKAAITCNSMHESEKGTRHLSISMITVLICRLSEQVSECRHPDHSENYYSITMKIN